MSKLKIWTAAELRSRRNPGSNQGPLDLQSNALPTELFRLTRNMDVHVQARNFKNDNGNLDDYCVLYERS